jgi:polar amino acid transport system substrate-binding protein
MLRNRALALAAVASTALALTACGSDSLSPGSSSSAGGGSSSATSGSSGGADPALVAKLPAKVKSAGVIKVGVDATYAPNEFLDTDGKTVIGMDVDIFNLVAAKFGVKAEYVPAGFGTIILGVNSGKFDVGVSSFTINPEREKQATMVSYLNVGTQWVVAKGNPKKIDPANACGMTIGAQKDTVQVDDLNARSKKCKDAGKPAINIIVDADQGKVTSNLVSGKTAAMLADSPIGLYAVQQTSGQLEALGDIYDSAPYGFVLPKDQTDFGQAMVDALKSLSTSGEYQKAVTKWMGKDTGTITDFAVNPVK